MPMYPEDVELWKAENTDVEATPEERRKDLVKQLDEEMHTHYVKDGRLLRPVYPELRASDDSNVWTMRIYERKGPEIYGTLCDKK